MLTLPITKLLSEVFFNSTLLRYQANAEVIGSEYTEQFNVNFVFSRTTLDGSAAIEGWLKSKKMKEKMHLYTTKPGMNFMYIGNLSS